MIEVVKRNILKNKEVRKIGDKYLKYDASFFSEFKIPKITIHGRFQPPLHVNHFYTYVAIAFQIADKVEILVTNPDLDETPSAEALHRSDAENNPFSYEERVEIFNKFFEKIGIPSERFSFVPFKITEDSEWGNVLDMNVFNLINTYGEWSEAKLAKFRRLGYSVIHSSFPKLDDISGTSIRKTLRGDLNLEDKREALIEDGIMEEAVDGILEIWNRK